MFFLRLVSYQAWCCKLKSDLQKKKKLYSTLRRLNGVWCGTLLAEGWVVSTVYLLHWWTVEIRSCASSFGI